MEYFSAVEALNKSQQSKDDDCNYVLDYIFKCIENAAKKGDTSVLLYLLEDGMIEYYNCSLRVQSRLKSLGYKVKETRASAFDTQSGTLFVSWLNPKIPSGFRCLG